MKICTKKRNCSDCGTEFVAYDIDWMGRQVFHQQRCESCTEAAQRDYDAAEKVAHIEQQQMAFAAVCPPLYRETNLSQLHSKFRQVAQTWRYGSRGLGLVGSSGMGKTRIAYWLLRQMLTSGHSIQATNATTFARLCVDQFADDRIHRSSAVTTIYSYYSVDVWLLDDLGQHRMTDRVEAELYAVLERRTTQRLPTIWTSNAMGEDLAAMFSDKRSEAIMRRLTDFNDIVTVWQEEALC